MTYFLVTRDPKCPEATWVTYDDAEPALVAFERAEVLHRGTRIIVSLLAADSMQTLRETHGALVGAPRMQAHNAS